MRNGAELDKIDMRILVELSHNPRITLTELSENTKISRPTISTHLKNLTDSGLIMNETGLSLRNLNFVTALVSIEAKQENESTTAEKFLRSCPRVKCLFRTPGKANLTVLVWGENTNTLNSTIESFRDLSNVEIVDIDYLGTPIHGDLGVGVFDKRDTAPCKEDCSRCPNYKNKLCVGCPATIYYKGP